MGGTFAPVRRGSGSPHPSDSLADRKTRKSSFAQYIHLPAAKTARHAQRVGHMPADAGACRATMAGYASLREPKRDIPQ